MNATKKLLRLLILPATMLLSTSCKKEPIEYTFEGIVYSSETNSGLQGAVVDISQKVYNGNTVSSTYSTAGLVTTGSDGSYSVSFERKKVFEFQVEVTKAGYFDHQAVISSADVSVDQPYQSNPVIDPKSWVTFHLTNIGGLASDQFTMVYYNFREGCSGCTTNDYYYFDGIVDSTFTICTTGAVYAKYSRKNPGSVVYQTDSVYAIPFDTAFVTITY